MDKIFLLLNFNVFSFQIVVRSVRCTNKGKSMQTADLVYGLTREDTRKKWIRYINNAHTNALLS